MKLIYLVTNNTFININANMQRTSDNYWLKDFSFIILD